MTGPSFRDVFAAEPKTVVTVTGRVSGYPCSRSSGGWAAGCCRPIGR